MIHGHVPLLHDLPDPIGPSSRRKGGAGVGQHRVTYDELEARSNALAHHLVARGVARGDRVIIFADNTVETVVCVLGRAQGQRGGLASSTRSPRATSSPTCSTTAGRPRSSPTGISIRCSGNPPRHAGRRGGDRLRDHRRRRAGRAAPCGTLGRGVWRRHARPAGAQLHRHRSRGHHLHLGIHRRSQGRDAHPPQHADRGTSITTYLENREDDVILGVLPLAFDYGLYQMIMAFRMGARLVLERSFTFPAQVLKHGRGEGVTGFPGVPTIFAILAELKSIKELRSSRRSATSPTPRRRCR